jgi:hypothetical protein
MELYLHCPYFFLALYLTSLGYRIDEWIFVVRFLAEAKFFSLLHSFQTGCGPIRCPVQGAAGAFFSGRGDGQVVKLTAHHHLVFSLRVLGAVH